MQSRTAQRDSEDGGASRTRGGFSLIEILVVVAIILVVLSFLLPAVSRALRKGREAMIMTSLQDLLRSDLAERANTVRDYFPKRPECRGAFRVRIGRDKYATQLLYIVRSDAEFRAYWHTLINPDNDDPLEFDRRHLLAKNSAGQVYPLRPGSRMAWEFLCTDLKHMNSSQERIGVVGVPESLRQQTDPPVFRPWAGTDDKGFVAYPTEFPASQTVMQISHQYMEKYGE